MQNHWSACPDLSNPTRRPLIQSELLGRWLVPNWIPGGSRTREDSRTWGLDSRGQHAFTLSVFGYASRITWILVAFIGIYILHELLNLYYVGHFSQPLILWLWIIYSKICKHELNQIWILHDSSHLSFRQFDSKHIQTPGIHRLWAAHLTIPLGILSLQDSQSAIGAS